MDINYKNIFFRLLPYILVELLAFFFVDYIFYAKPPFSDGTAFGVAFCTYFFPVFLMVIRIKSLLAKWAVVLGSVVYLAFALDILSKLHYLGLLFSAILFLPGFIVLLIVVSRTEPPWDWRTLFR